MKVAINRRDSKFRLGDPIMARCIALGMTVSPVGAMGEMLDPSADFSVCGTGYLDRKRHQKDFRSNPILVQAIEEARLNTPEDSTIPTIVEIPFDTTEGWAIEESLYGGEVIRENHRTWRD